jgi:hypothetical protein
MDSTKRDFGFDLDVVAAGLRRVWTRFAASRALPYALAAMVVGASVAAAAVSWWLVPPYLLLIGYLLLEPDGRRVNATNPARSDQKTHTRTRSREEVGASASASSRGRGSRASRSGVLDDSGGEVADESIGAGASVSASSGSAGASASGRRGSKKARKGRGSVDQPVPASWVQVAPGKFVRVEAGGPSGETGPHPPLAEDSLAAGPAPETGSSLDARSSSDAAADRPTTEPATGEPDVEALTEPALDDAPSEHPLTSDGPAPIGPRDSEPGLDSHLAHHDAVDVPSVVEAFATPFSNHGQVLCDDPESGRVPAFAPTSVDASPFATIEAAAAEAFEGPEPSLAEEAPVARVDEPAELDAAEPIASDEEPYDEEVEPADDDHEDENDADAEPIDDDESNDDEWESDVSGGPSRLRLTPRGALRRDGRTPLCSSPGVSPPWRNVRTSVHGGGGRAGVRSTILDRFRAYARSRRDSGRPRRDPRGRYRPRSPPGVTTAS